MSADADKMVASEESADSPRPRVVILGGGFGGLNAALALRKADLEVVLVDKENYHLFQPLLYQVATAGLSPGDIAAPIRAVLRKQQNARVLLAEARSVDRQRRVVELDTGQLAYDYLIVATGTQTKFFGPEEWAEESTGLKTIQDALSLRRQILYAFERAEQTEEPDEIAEWLTFVIIGGGPTGVEMAGAIREIAAEVMVRDFRTIRPEEARVVLIDAQPRILTSYPEELSEKAKEELEKRGVELWLDSPVDEITGRSVRAGEYEAPTRTVVWAAGVEPGSLIGTLETELTEAGQVLVEEALTLPGDERVFAIGDIAHFEHYGEEPLPGLAPVAIQQGKAAAKNIRRRLDGEEFEAFHYWDRGQMSTIGRKAAVGVVGDWKFEGFFAWLVWLFIHLLFLVGFRNKVSVLIEWAYSYIAYKRSARLIVEYPESREVDQPADEQRLLEDRPAEEPPVGQPEVERAESRS